MACSRSLFLTILRGAKNNIASRGYNSKFARILARYQHQEAHNGKDVIELKLENEFGKQDDTTRLDPFSKVDRSISKRAFINDLYPPLKRSYNLAAYVNQSETLQELVKMGVSLFDIENTNPQAAKHLVMLDFGRDCAPYIRFLVDNGLKKRHIGRFISDYPDIFRVPLNDLKIRIKYLAMKGFSNKQIALALNTSRHIISNNVKSLDYKLGELQVEFQMPADIIRTVVSKYPPVVSLPSSQYKMINFALAHEFGFKLEEVHRLLEAQPYMMDISRPVLLQRLELVHNQIGLSHETICKFPKLITGPKLEIRHRFLYLEKLNRNQFDPEKPLYVPPSALYEDDDEEFCKKYSKTSLDDYKLFLKHR